MGKNLKRFLSLLLACVMLMSSIPISTLASEPMSESMEVATEAETAKEQEEAKNDSEETNVETQKQEEQATEAKEEVPQEPVTEAKTEKTEEATEQKAEEPTEENKEENKEENLEEGDTNKEEAAEEDKEEDKDEEDDETEKEKLYTVTLPKNESVKYSVNESHVSKNNDEKYVLEYKEKEDVSFKVETSKEWNISGKESSFAIKSSDFDEGNVSFKMPADDISLKFKEEDADSKEKDAVYEEYLKELADEGMELADESAVPESVTVPEAEEQPVENNEEAEEVEDIEASSEEAQTEELSTEAPVEEIIENADIPTEETEDLTGYEAEFIDTIESMKLESGNEVNDAFNEYVDGLFDPNLFEEEGSTFDAGRVNVWIHDTSFDYANYIPDTYYVDDVKFELYSGSIDFSAAGDNEVIYKTSVVGKEDYFWFTKVTFCVVDNKAFADVCSGDIETMMYSEQSSDFPGVVPSTIGATVDGGEYTVLVNSDISLYDINIGYDSYHYFISPQDDGGFDIGKVGDYNVLYAVTSEQTSGFMFYVNTLIHVVDSVEHASGVYNVVVTSPHLKAMVTDRNGTNHYIGYGDTFTSEGISSVVVLPARLETIRPEINGFLNGEAIDVVESGELKDDAYFFELRNIELSSEDTLIINIDYPDFDPERDNSAKSTGGFDLAAILEEGQTQDDYFDSLIGYTGSTTPLEATLLKTISGGTGGVSADTSSAVHNYNPEGYGYHDFYVSLNSSFLKQIADYLEKKGVKATSSYNGAIEISCYSGGNYAAATSAGMLGVSTTARFYDNDGDSSPDYFTISCSGSTGMEGWQSYSGGRTVNLKDAVGEIVIIKVSDAPEAAYRFDGIKINTKFTFYDNKKCRDQDKVFSVRVKSSGPEAVNGKSSVPPGKYWYKETSRSPGHAEDSAVQGPITITAGKSKEVRNTNRVFYTTGIIAKKVGPDNKPLAGAVFKVVANTGDKVITYYLGSDANGEVKLSPEYFELAARYYGERDIPYPNGFTDADFYMFNKPDAEFALPQCTLSVTEVLAPEGYIITDPNPRTYALVADDVTQPAITYTTMTFVDELDKGYMKVKKVNALTNDSTVPDSNYYSLAGMEVGIYSDEGCTTKVATLTTGANGESDVIGLKSGTYYAREDVAPEGFKKNDDVVPVPISCGYTQTAPFVHTIPDYPETGSLVFKKKLDPEEPGAIAEKRDMSKIEFSLQYVNDSKYNLGQIHVDKDGNGRVDGLLLGNWILSETVPLEYHKAMEPKTITIEGAGAEHEIEDVINYTVHSRIIISKRDSATNNLIKLPGYTFNILDENKNVVEIDGLTEFTTGEDGSVTFNEKLMGGKYYIHELTPPEDATYKYSLSDDKEFEITEDSDVAVEYSMEDEMMWTTVQLYKYDKDTGETAGPGFKFNIIADENIVDGSGATYPGYEKGAVVDTMVTNDDGIATSTAKLYIGKYHIEEDKTSVPAGYHPTDIKVPVTVTKENAENHNPIIFDLTDDLPVVADTPVTRPIHLVKKDNVSGNGAGGGFTYEIIAVDVRDGKGVVRKGFEAGTVIETIVTDENSEATSSKLYCGTYTVKEVKRGIGYCLSSPLEKQVTISDDNKTEEPIEVEFKNAPIEKDISVTKIDEVTGNHCRAGFVFNIVAVNVVDGSGVERKGYEKDAVVDTITTNDEGIATSKKHYLGDYYLEEVEVPDDGGMAINTEKYFFTLSDDEEDNTKDDEALNIILDPFADKPTTLKIKKVDSVSGKSLAGITFRVKEKDTDDSDEQLFVTDAEGNIKVEYLLKNKTYTIQEVKTIPGYNLNKEVIEFSVDDKGLIDGKNELEVTIKNIPNEVHISKEDITNSKEIPGAHLKITRKEDGSVYEEWTSGDTPHIIYAIPAGTYILTEITAPYGYELAESIEFEVKDSLEIQTHIMYDSPFREVVFSKTEMTGTEEIPGCTLTVKDEQGNVVETWVSTTQPHSIKLHSGKYTLTEDRPAPGYVTSETIAFEVIKTSAEDFAVMSVHMVDERTKVEISKKDITDEDEIPGAKLEIYDEDENLVEKWTSKEEPHYIEKLPIGKYTLVEKKPADGYVTAESVEFTVDDTPEIQHVDMFDDVTKVKISKQDITSKKELPGATLVIKDKNGKEVEKWVSTNEPHYIEQLPIGDYTLTEITAPEGYSVAETISFTVEDTDEIQHVTMFDSPAPANTKKETPSPQTGDNLDVQTIIWIIVIIVVLLLTGGYIFYKGKKKKKDSEE